MWKEPAKLAVLAAAYAESGDFTKAVRWQKAAVNGYLDPEDRKLGLERLELYKQKKPCRVAGGPAADPHRGDSSEGSKWVHFPDPELAARIFAELQERIGERPDATDARAREAWERKITSIDPDRCEEAPPQTARREGLLASRHRGELIGRLTLPAR